MTIYEKLTQKLGRQPTHQEQVAEVKRILEDGMVEMAAKGLLADGGKELITVDWHF